MTKPLALCYYENSLLGNQLVNRLQDLGYRVETVGDPGQVVPRASQDCPFVVLMDLGFRTEDTCRVITELKQKVETSHVPILAFGPQRDGAWQASAHTAGATLVAVDSGLLQQLPDLLDHVLRIE